MAWLSTRHRSSGSLGRAACRSARVVIATSCLGVDAGFLALLGRDGRGRTRERVLPSTGLGEGDDITDAAGSSQEHAQTIKPKGDAAMRWGPVLERLKQEPELALCLFGRHAQQGKYALLHIALVDTDGAATNLISVADNVVGPRQSLVRSLLEAIPPFLVR